MPLPCCLAPFAPALHDSLLPALIAIVNGNPLIPNQTAILLVLNTFGPIVQQMVGQVITASTASAASDAVAASEPVAPEPAMTPCDYALLAQEAYSARPDIGKADSASRAIVRMTGAGLVVAFPGTDNFDCWDADFDVIPVSVHGLGQVHRGFLEAWQAIAAPVAAAIGNQPVTFVGHSLGAAIAIIGAAALTVAGKPPTAVYGFEPPRVSPDLTIRSLLAKVPVHLYKNGNDLVPEVPFGWQHAALLTHIGKPVLPFANVQDHAIARVISALSGG